MVLERRRVEASFGSLALYAKQSRTLAAKPPISVEISKSNVASISGTDRERREADRGSRIGEASSEPGRLDTFGEELVEGEHRSTALGPVEDQLVPVGIESLEDTIAFDPIGLDEGERLRQGRLGAERLAVRVGHGSEAAACRLRQSFPGPVPHVWLDLVLEHANPTRCRSRFDLCEPDMDLAGARSKGRHGVAWPILSVDPPGVDVHQIAPFRAGALSARKPLTADLDHRSVVEQLDRGVGPRSCTEPRVDASLGLCGRRILSQRLDEPGGAIEHPGDAPRVLGAQRVLQPADESTEARRRRCGGRLQQPLEGGLHRRGVLRAVRTYTGHRSQQVVECVGELVCRAGC